MARGLFEGFFFGLKKAEGLGDNGFLAIFWLICQRYNNFSPMHSTVMKKLFPTDELRDNLLPNFEHQITASVRGYGFNLLEHS